MTNKKALLVSTISGFVPQFEMNSVQLLQENGYEVHYATNYNNVFYGKDNSRLDGTSIIRHQIDFSRSPYSKQTLIAYRQLKRLFAEEDFAVIHCHTPIGSFLSRFAGRKKSFKMVYTAHGFHFFQGAPWINWLIYYNAERFMAHFTDALITMNEEDYKNAKRFSLRHGGSVYKIPGAGINLSLFSTLEVDSQRIKAELGLNKDSFVLISVGELNKNKNHKIVIEAISKLKDLEIIYVICGEGDYRQFLEKEITRLGVEKQVYLLGYRRDVPELLRSADLFVFPSFREGLPVALMEAMAAGLPVIASDIRGNKDLIENGINGFLLSPDSVDRWAEKIQELKVSPNYRESMKKQNFQKIQAYDKKNVKEVLRNIYKDQGII